MKSKLQNNNKKSHRTAKPLSQLDRANETLLALAKDVTTEDRKQIIEGGLLSEPHLIKYLKGNGTDLDKVMNLIRFIRERILERDRVLSGAA